MVVVDARPTGINATCRAKLFPHRTSQCHNSIYIDTKFPGYKELAKVLLKRFENTHGIQPGDLVKGVERIIDVVERAPRPESRGQIAWR